MKTPYIEAKHMVKSLFKYYDEQNKKIDESTKGSKKISGKR